MIHYSKFTIKITEHLANSSPMKPEDSLGELSQFDLGLRTFCYEFNRIVIVRIGDFQFQVPFDPDICILLQDIHLPEQIKKLAEDKAMRLEFMESADILLMFYGMGEKVNCRLIKFPADSVKDQFYVLEKAQVLSELKGFLNDVLSMAVDRGYISLADKDDFIAPAFPERLQSQILV